jgi:hypothetical protein
MHVAAVALTLVLATGLASAQSRVIPGVPFVAPWVTASCWIEPRWFESLRSGPVDYCKRSLRYRPGRIDCLAFIDEVCWALNRETGDWQQLRTSGRETLIACPQGPEPPTCPRLR